MGKNRSFGNDDDLDYDFDELEEPEYDAEEDAMPCVHTVIRRDVELPIPVKIEATVAEDNTYIKFYRPRNPDKFCFCFVDTIDPEMLLTTLENKFSEGLLEEVEDFFAKYGRSISDPVRFRIKLDAIVQPSGEYGGTL